MSNRFIYKDYKDLGFKYDNTVWKLIHYLDENNELKTAFCKLKIHNKNEIIMNIENVDFEYAVMIHKTNRLKVLGFYSYSDKEITDLLDIDKLDITKLKLLNIDKLVNLTPLCKSYFSRKNKNMNVIYYLKPTLYKVGEYVYSDKPIDEDTNNGIYFYLHFNHININYDINIIIDCINSTIKYLKDNNRFEKLVTKINKLLEES